MTEPDWADISAMLKWNVTKLGARGAIFSGGTSALSQVSGPRTARSDARCGGGPARPDGTAASFAQQRLWFLDRFEPGNVAYNMPHLSRFKGPLDIWILERAFNEVIRRHESLRTTFADRDGMPVLVVAPELAVPLRVEDFEDQADSEAAAWRRISEEASTPFDLVTGPLVRLLLARVRENDHLLLTNIHHAVSDGWSLRVLFREVREIYGALLAGRAAELPALPMQYGDHAAAQAEQVHRGDLDLDLSYWQQRLAGAPPLLNLPMARPRCFRQTYRGDKVWLGLSRERTEALREFGRSHHASPFMLLLAVFKTLLFRYTGETDLVIGFPVSGRGQPEWKEIIGMFVNTLALRTDLSGDPAFLDLLERVREGTVDALTHQRAPFDVIVARLKPERNPGYSPIFQVMLAFNSKLEMKLELPGVTSIKMPWPPGAARFDLELAVEEDAGELTIDFTFNADLFDRLAIERMAGHFETLLEGVLADPGSPISSLPILTAPERRQLLVEWNDTAAPCPAGKRIHELFAEQVKKTPNAVAAVFADQELTYGQLDKRARQLAGHLRSLGVGPEVLVGLYVNCSLDMVVGVFGILLAGGAYVPLDPAYPQERLAFILEDTDLKVLVTERSLAPLLPAHHAEMVFVDSAWPPSEITAPGDGGGPENLAYVIYTSGSTGRPKGVAIEHRNVVALIRWAHEMFSAEELAGVLASTSICFDLSVFELFVPLTRGGKVILARNILELPLQSAAGQVTLINTVPSGIAELLRLGNLPSSVATVNMAGESLKQSLVQQIHGQRSVRRVYDLYGPTEDTVYSTGALRQREGIETIGRPIANKQAYILDEARQPVPVGITGELYVGGAGVGRGYLNRPDLTAERFTANPFRPEAGARLYRTGDLCRYLPDGNIEFLGRRDHQVKIRGFRIELGEIESVLQDCPGVRECVVIAREDEPGDQRLAAYFVALDPDSAPAVEELRDVLKRKLMDYMVPAAFVRLESLPLTPNGKIDRKALPRPEASRAQARQTYVAPRTATEEMLAGIWTAVLRIAEVGVQDNFFVLGGHSLLATQVVSRIRRTLNAEVPLRTFFELPTIESLAGWLQTSGIEIASPLRPPVSAGIDRPLPLSSAQKGLWFLDRFQGGSTEYNIPEAIRLRGPLNRDALERAINAIVTRHESLRTRFVETDGEPAQLVSATLQIATVVEDLRALDDGAQEKAIAAALRRECEAPFELSEGPLLRVTLLQLGEQDHVLMQTCHHIVSDDWSMGILKRELVALYNAFCEGRNNPLEPLPAQYPDYVLWQRQRLAGEDLDRLLAYWTGKLAGAPSLLAIPTDRPRTADRSHRGESRTLLLSAALTRSLAGLSQREGATIFMALLAAFKVLLARHSGQDDIVIGIPIAGRTQDFAEKLIGFFVNTLALRTDLSDNPTFKEALKRVRATALDAYTHQDLPFEKLIEKLHPDRELTHTPVFQVFFNMFNGDQPPLGFAGVEAEAIPMPEPEAKFDITFYAMQEADRIRLRAVYNTHLFEAVTIERLLHRFQTLIEGIVADPDQRIGALPLLAAEDRRRLSVHDNPVRPTNEFAQFAREEVEQSIPARFEKAVKLCPGRCAVKTSGHEWTYAELHHRSNLVARKILRLCGEGSQTIALLLDHDAPMIAAIIGVLKAGKSYVPLDPFHPKGRLAHIMADAHAQTIVTDAENESLARDLSSNGVEPFSLDGIDWTAPAGDIGLAISPDAIAYVLYTSGSTGLPKGVEQTHGNVLRHIRNYTNGLHICHADRLSLLASYSFDAAVMDIFGALLNGATLQPYSVQTEGVNDLAEWMAEQEITIYHSTPTLYRHLVGTLTDRNVFPRLRLIVMGGEKVVPQDVELYLERFGPDCIFVNGYGPTECTVALQCFLNPGAKSWGQTIPVGYAVDDAGVLLLNPQGDAGQVYGEIAIRSPGLALGYRHQPELTDAVFKRDPDSKHSRIYRTGDMGRLLTNGMIDFIGRRDFQVKIRGHRVELGEVEAALAGVTGVSQAVVIAREDGGAARLVAYVVPEAGAAPEPKALRRCLLERLPDYMAPSAFVLLEKLPLTPNGKIDRRALPVPALTSRTDAGPDYRAPRTPIEEVLTGIWAEVLKVEVVGVHDNFFELGGHSFQATQLVSRIRRALQVELPLRTLFEFPTVAGLAGKLPAIQGRSASSIPPLATADAGGPLPLSFAQ